jgi:hypothetical protein
MDIVWGILSSLLPHYLTGRPTAFARESSGTFCIFLVFFPILPMCFQPGQADVQVLQDRREAKLRSLGIPGRGHGVKVSLSLEPVRSILMLCPVYAVK